MATHSKLKHKQCIICSKPAFKTFCSNACQGQHSWNRVKEKLLLTGIDQSVNCRSAKRLLLETKGHRCESCKLTEWLGKPIPLTLDHINGNADDCRLINFRLVCANCDRQSEFFGSKNRGNGRAWRRKRYHEGKSY